jgi:hypothetical protein
MKTTQELLASHGGCVLEKHLGPKTNFFSKLRFGELLPLLALASIPPRRPGFEPRSGHVGFVVDKVALGHVFFEYFGFPCQFSFH